MRPDEYERLGAITVEAYVTLDGHVHEPDYERELADVRARATATDTAVLVAVLVPGVGREVNGSRRWIPLGIATFQPSEVMKLLVVLYAADYTVRKAAFMDDLRKGFLPMFGVMTLIAAHYGAADYNKVVKPALTIPILNLRTWAFVFCFFSIGLTTRFRELAAAGGRNFWAFSTGAVVNVILGFIMSTMVFYEFWAHLGQ